MLHGGEIKSTPSPRPKTGVWQKNSVVTMTFNLVPGYWLPYWGNIENKKMSLFYPSQSAPIQIFASWVWLTGGFKLNTTKEIKENRD